MSLEDAIAAAPNTPRAQAAVRLVREAHTCITTAEQAHGGHNAVFAALTRRQRRHLVRLPQALAYLGAYMQDLGFELEVTLVPARQHLAEVRGASAAQQEARDGD